MEIEEPKGRRVKVLSILLAFSLITNAVLGCWVAWLVVIHEQESVPALAGFSSMPLDNSSDALTVSLGSSSSPESSATTTPPLVAELSNTPELTATPKASPSEAVPTMTPVAVKQPPLMTRLLEKYSHDANQLPGKLFIMVVKDKKGTKLYVYQKNSDGLWKMQGESCVAYVGRNGLSDNKIEGDNCTPTGLYNIGIAFGNAQKPDIQWEFRQVTKNSYWVDDPNSKYYNIWVESTSDKDWKSAEYLSEMKISYAYALVIEYNTEPIVPGKGSAIFLHCGSSATVGCVAISKARMLEILELLRSDSNPQILIADDQ